MTLQIKSEVDLKNYSSMRLGGKAAFLVELNSRFDVPNAIDWAEKKSLPYVVIGHGNCIVWREEGYPGLVMVNKIKRFEHIDEDDNNVYFNIGAGETWDEVVQISVDLGFADLAALSYIPGTAGAQLINNSGAYGSEIAQSLVSVEVYDCINKQFVTIPSFECGLGHNTSRFKSSDNGRYIITGLSLHLTRRELEPPFYGDLQHYLTEHGVKKYTPETIRQSVLAIRTLTLPDPKKTPHCGQYFSNPVISQARFHELRIKYPELKHWPADNNNIQVSVAWLVEHACSANVSDKNTGMSTWPGQPLVVVNNNATSTHQLEAFVANITNAVKKKYGIVLESEVRIIP